MKNAILKRVSIRICSCLFLLLAASVNANAQIWYPLGADDSLGQSGMATAQTYNNNIAIDTDGTPYMFYSDAHYHDSGSVKKWNGIQWVAAGTLGNTPLGGTESAFAVLGGNTYTCSIINTQSPGIYGAVMKYDGSSLTMLGSLNSIPTGNTFDMEIDGSGTPYVTTDSNTAIQSRSVMKWDGSNWGFVGTQNIIGPYVRALEMAVTNSGNVYVAFVNMHDSASVFMYNGSNWASVGSADFAVTGSGGSGIQHISIALDNNDNPYVAFPDATNSSTTDIWKFNGSNWLQVGNTIPMDLAGNHFTANLHHTIVVDKSSNTPYVLCQNSNTASGGGAFVYKYDGTNWNIVGNGRVSTNSGGFPSLAVNKAGIPFVGYAGVNSTGYNDGFVKEYNVTAAVRNVSAVLQNIDLFPNPNTGNFTLSGSIGTNVNTGDAKLEIMNGMGQLIYSDKIVVSQNQINTSIQLDGSLANGTYFLRIKLNDETRTVCISVMR